MITFPETLDALERLSENMHLIEGLDASIQSALNDLDGFLSMLQYSHEKEFKNAGEALEYIDTVLIPQLHGIRDSLATSTEDPVKRLRLAGEQTERLAIRMKMVVNGDMGEFLP